MPNINCLEDFECPRCKQTTHFYITSKTVMNVTDEGAEPLSDIEWDESSHTCCPNCGLTGDVSDFKK